MEFTNQNLLLINSYETLIDILDSCDLVGRLCQTGFLNRKQVNFVNSKGTNEEQNRTLLEFLRIGSLDFYLQTIRCLHESNQSHIARLFESGGDYKPEFGGNWPLMEKERAILLDNYENLIDILNSNDLVGLLCQIGVLSRKQANLVNSKETAEEQNKIFLEFLRIGSMDFYWQTIRCLRESNQSHIANLFESGGVYKPEFGGIWPLMEKERAILLANYENLIDILDSSELIVLLYQSRVLNKRQRNLFSSIGTPEVQNKLLLELLRKGSLDGYWQWIRCLRTTKQSHIAEIFESGGVVVRIDANLPLDLSNLTEIENSIVAQITNMLRRASVSDASRLLEEVQLNLVGAAAKHSVSLYFLCSDEGDIDRLEQMEATGTLRKFVEDLFNRLMRFSTKINVMLKWSRHLFPKFRNSIKATQMKNFNDEPMKTTIQCLPLELLDYILQKAFLRSRARPGAKDSDIVVCLGSVDVPWFQRILRKRFIKPILPQLERICRREFEMYLSLRACLSYLEEATQVEEARLLKRKEVLSANFLTDLHFAQLTKRKTKNKLRLRCGAFASLALEIFSAGKGRIEIYTFYHFRGLLLRGEITNGARVLGERGATVKVEIRKPKNSKTDAWSRGFSRRLNDLKDKTTLKSGEIKKILQQLKDFGIKFLDSFVDRGVSVWLWCKSQNAVETLKALYKSQTLIDQLYQLASENDRKRSNKDIHLDELSQLKIDPTSFRNFVINIEAELSMEDACGWVIGMTKLRNKIFVLSRSLLPSPLHYVAYVFGDQRPFNLQRKLHFEEIKFTKDISSFENSFCLYIADSVDKCIWKIRPPDEDKIKDGEFTCSALNFPELSKFDDFRKTITDGGQILIVVVGKPILLIYESESAVDCPIRIDLPDTIKRPLQVAENSAGNCILLHRRSERNSSGGKDPWVVSEVSRNGKTIIRHCGMTDDLFLELGVQGFLLVDPNDRVFLPDKMRSRLILLDSFLRYECYFVLDIEEEDTNRFFGPLFPRKMFIDGEKRQLIVVGNIRVLVLNFNI